jgi:hypothetical protein
MRDSGGAESMGATAEMAQTLESTGLVFQSIKRYILRTDR